MTSLREALGGNQKVLWISSSGGHLAEARRIAQQVSSDPDSLWLTPKTADAMELEITNRVHWIPYIHPRAVREPLKVARLAREFARNEGFDVCISTGAAVAAFALPAVAATGTRAVYVESLARPFSPSLTGKLIYASRIVETLVQHPTAARDRWSFRGSVLDVYQPQDRTPAETRRVFVSLGTIRPYRFDRAVDAILSWLPGNVDIVWQTGATKRSDLPGISYELMGPEQFRAEITRADIVFTHAGVGNILTCLESGKPPVLLVRDSNFREHVDNHQQQIAQVMQSSGLASILDLNVNDHEKVIERARRREIKRVV